MKFEKLLKSKPAYVVITERDCAPDSEFGGPPNGPIIHEHYIDKHTSLESCQKRVKTFAGRYGEARIARLEFLDEVGPPKTEVTPCCPECGKNDEVVLDTIRSVSRHSTRGYVGGPLPAGHCSRCGNIFLIIETEGEKNG